MLTAIGCTQLHTAKGGRNSWTIPGVLRLGDVAEPDSLNPLLSTMDLSYDLSSLTFSYLIVADGHGKPTGDLATQVPSLENGGISRDGRTYVYHLHRGVLWHDGARLTSRDVAFTWRTIMDARNNVLHREGFQEVQRIDAPDDVTLVVHLRRRYPPFLTQFFTTLQEGAKPVLPEHLLAHLREINDAAYNALPVGSGPFRFASWDRGQRIVLVANERYFRGPPRLRRIEVRVVPDVNTLMTLMRTHEVDMPVSATPLMYVRFRDASGFRTMLTPWNSQSILALNNGRPTLRYLEVREAIAWAIDYDALIQKIWYGTARRAQDIVPPTAVGYLDEPPYRYDPGAATALLARFGWRPMADGVRSRKGQRLELVMVIAAGGTSEAVGVQLQSMLRRIGIGLTLKAYPYRGIYAFDGPIVRGNYDLALFANTLSYDPDNTARLACNQFAPKGENEVRYCDRTVDALEGAGLTTDESGKRAAIYRVIAKRVRATVPFVPLLMQQRITVANSDLSGYDPAPVAAPWWNAREWSI
ncbi:MAG: peptide ABC transporter substrate-binding protein [Candidatus Eremiobacteraeota bacterium]|nr:peptide ABC transporter substrate-binding protein [Candidatus Eremiobacteraeota bacterium]